jgi:pimeloyl-ACP methyl ester carboxylesterase
MPHINIDGTKLHFEEQGRGAETVVFAHGLLWSGRMFAWQVQALRENYRCITFDFRGQGSSEVTADGYDIDRLTEDAAKLIEALGGSPCHFVGLSMGGFVGMRLAIRQPDLLRSLTLLNTSADPEPKGKVARYRRLALVARWFGLGFVVNRAMPIMFGAAFLSDPRRAAVRKKWRAELLANHRVGVTRAIHGVVTRQGVYDQLDQITVPTLVIVGEYDVATPPDVGQRIHHRIPSSRLVTIRAAGHTSTVEEPEAVNTAIVEFLDHVTILEHAAT